MLYVLGGLSLLFLVVAFIVTESNAPYLLSGYNTLSEADKKKFYLAGYIPFFRKFHIFLGLSFFLIGLLVHTFISENAGGVFVGVYPILAYLYFIWSSQKFSGNVFAKQTKVGLVIGVAALAFVIGIFGLAFKENQLLINPQSIELTGVYGELIPISDIESIALVAQLPAITIRKNGFAASSVRKGYFGTRAGKKVKLLMHTKNPPFIQITKKNGEQIFFAAKDKPSDEIFRELKTRSPQLP
ncbi:DUF3784 domain-containing protein [Adhaeribacter swui]|uniref:DUF3784 domain-containing protein n=1 Tax=Adhaeribacter swui TaxID=2086471 RepID=A0A7G7GD64_9BACT|nr:DUF3784 domain-containing protein [Adhaeribacter swui]QNF35098.1 DUF3784 domain-containing protein [Adhaeribacter swui]